MSRASAIFGNLAAVMDNREDEEESNIIDVDFEQIPSFGHDSMGTSNLQRFIENGCEIPEDDWDMMVCEFGEMVTPFEEITRKGTYAHKYHSEDDDNYDDMFKEETALIHNVLVDINKDKKVINKLLHSQSKGSKGIIGGVGKSPVSELLNASATLNNAQLSAIKALVDVKKTAAKLRADDKKNMGDSSKVEAQADALYQKLVGGSMYSNPSIPRLTSNSLDYETSQFNAEEYSPLEKHGLVEQPEEEFQPAEDYDPEMVSEFIARERGGVTVYVVKTHEGIEFCAMTDKGTMIPNYSGLPDPSEIDTLKITPGSSYAVDRLSRRYKILDYTIENEEDYEECSTEDLDW